MGVDCGSTEPFDIVIIGALVYVKLLYYAVQGFRCQLVPTVGIES